MDPTCLEARRLAQSKGFFVVLIMKAILCILGICATTCSLKVRGNAWLVHPNARILYVFHIFWTFQVPITFLICFVFEIIRVSIPHEDACDYPVPAPIGVTLRGLPSFGVATQSFTMCGIAIERAISTLFPFKYEQVKKPYFGYFLGIAAIVFASFEIFFLLIAPVDWSERMITSTLRTSSNAKSYQTFMSVYTSVEVCTISIFVISLVINSCQFYKSSGKPLSWKYQIKENRKVIRALLPGFITHFLLNGVMIISLQLYYMFVKGYDSTSSAIVIEASSHVQLYSLILPLIIAFRFRRKRRVIVDEHNDMNNYFAQMTDFFDKNYTTRQAQQ